MPPVGVRQISQYNPRFKSPIRKTSAASHTNDSSSRVNGLAEMSRSTMSKPAYRYSVSHNKRTVEGGPGLAFHGRKQTGIGTTVADCHADSSSVPSSVRPPWHLATLIAGGR